MCSVFILAHIFGGGFCVVIITLTYKKYCLKLLFELKLFTGHKSKTYVKQKQTVCYFGNTIHL